MNENKLSIDLNEKPALVFVQDKFGSGITLYQDGKKVNGIRSLRIYAGYDEATTHEIEYLTGATKGDDAE